MSSAERHRRRRWFPARPQRCLRRFRCWTTVKVPGCCICAKLG